MMRTRQDDEYLAILVDAIRVCANYRPKLGHGGGEGYSLAQFQEIYRGDPFYSWMGLDNPLMYAAHKAAGGMTSIYRQIGIGCESLFRELLKDCLELDDADVNWSYNVRKARGKSRTLYLDARIPTEKVKDEARRKKIEAWIAEAGRLLDINSKVVASVEGIVFEVRQGYKSKDSKRQNADIANAATAYSKGYLPCAGILSMQIDEDIAIRYRNERWVLLTGRLGNASAHESIYAFMRETIGYELAAFFQRNSKKLKEEVNAVLTALLTAE